MVSVIESCAATLKTIDVRPSSVVRWKSVSVTLPVFVAGLVVYALLAFELITALHVACTLVQVALMITPLLRIAGVQFTHPDKVCHYCRTNEF
ncbi:hypothetical protein DIPPA_32690 [Diplonema papillatum]|nr:hypothetical protein DIPPA_32690 [Diplonema papillatum]